MNPIGIYQPLNKYNSHNPVFKGYREDIIIAEDVVKNIRRLGLTSSSALFHKYFRETLAGWHSEEFLNKLKKAALKERKKQDALFSKYLYGLTLNYAEIIKKLMVSLKAANCDGYAILARDALKEKGLKSVYIVECIFKTNKISGNHFFALANVKEGAKIENPRTWGKEAIMVDAWSGFAKRANEGLISLKNAFGYSKKTDSVIFRDFSNLRF